MSKFLARGKVDDNCEKSLGLTILHLFEERSGFVVNRRISLGLLVDPDIHL